MATTKKVTTTKVAKTSKPREAVKKTSLKRRKEVAMKSRSKDEAKGVPHETKGKIKEIAGEITGNHKLKAKNKIEKTVGNAQGKIGLVKHTTAISGITRYKEVGTTVEVGIVGGLKRITEIEADILDLVGNTVSNTLRAGGEAVVGSLSIAKAVVNGAITATEEVGTDLILGTKSVAKGIVMGVSDVSENIVTIASQTVKGSLKGVAEVGAVVAWVAQRGVEGVMEAAKGIGGNGVEVATSTVCGAIETAGNILNTTVNAVKNMLIGVVETVKDSCSGVLLEPRLQTGSSNAHSLTIGEIDNPVIRKIRGKKSK